MFNYDVSLIITFFLRPSLLVHYTILKCPILIQFIKPMKILPFCVVYFTLAIKFLMFRWLIFNKSDLIKLLLSFTIFLVHMSSQIVNKYYRIDGSNKLISYSIHKWQIIKFMYKLRHVDWISNYWTKSKKKRMSYLFYTYILCDQTNGKHVVNYIVCKIS